MILACDIYYAYRCSLFTHLYKLLAVNYLMIKRVFELINK